MKKRVADIIIETLIEEGVTDCFAVVGGGAMHIDNALALHDEMRKVFCHHEQACAMAAEGYAKLCDKPALVSVSSGPGALNTLNGVEGAYVDNVPMIVIAGHPRWETTVNYSGLNLRYSGVQEFDIVPAVQGMVKYAAYLLEPLKARSEIKKAIDIAMSGRRGPVWFSVPLDVQSAIVDTDELYEYENSQREEFSISASDLQELNDLISHAMRPVILAGSGIRTGGETDRFREWTARMKIPVLAGALLPDIMDENAPFFYGTSGNYGERRGNFILQNADLIIVIGNSLALKQTGFNRRLFAPNARIVMIDAGADEAKKPGLNIYRFWHADVRTFFDVAADKIVAWSGDRKWISYCDSLKEKIGDQEIYDNVPSEHERVSNAYLWNLLREKLPEGALIALGNSGGIKCIQRCVKKAGQRVIVNYNSGSMGDDLPEAVGMAIASNREVLCVTGDGSFMMNLQELQTIKHHDLPIKIIIMSNDGYNSLRQTYKNFFNGVNIGCDTESGISFPDFEKVIPAFGLPYKKCKISSNLGECLEWLLQEKSTAVLEIYQLLDDPVLPRLMSKMKPDGSIETPGLQDLYPFISEGLMEELMPGWEK